MTAQSAVIVIGTCERELPARFFVPGNSKADIVTDRIVRVTSALKGDLEAGARIAVEQLGGTMPSADGIHTVTKTIVHQAPLQPTSSYVLFLRHESQTVGDAFDGKRYVVTGEWAGVFAVVNGRIRASEAAEPVIKQLTGLSVADVVALIQKSQ